VNFEQSLKYGQIGEGKIAAWLKSLGKSVMPVYEKEINTGKGPQFFTPVHNLAAPDMLIFPDITWVEAKRKSAFTWFRNGNPPNWETGIDINHYRDYQDVMEISSVPVWLLFLHENNRPSDSDLGWGSPPHCPTGLFGQSLEYLTNNESHISDNWGRHGMVYWSVDKLKKLAEIEELEKING